MPYKTKEQHNAWRRKKYKEDKIYREKQIDRVKKTNRYKDKDWYKKKYHSNNEFRLRELDRSKKFNKSLKGKYNHYKYRSNRKNIDFIISIEEFIQLLSNNCFYCNTDKNIGLDRKNNNLGYIIENILPCCAECNYMKGTLSFNEFISKCKNISDRFYK